MRHRAVLLCILMALAGSGCAATSAPVTVQRAFTRCPRPAMPDLSTLDPEQHVCSPANLERLMEIVDRQCWMIGQQAAALDCYEAQAAGGQ